MLLAAALASVLGGCPGDRDGPSALLRPDPAVTVSGPSLRWARSALAEPAGLEQRDASGRTPLMLAAAVGDGGLVAELLDAGADPAARGPGGRSALHLAASAPRANARTLHQLLDAGAAVWARDGEGVSPLARAAGPGGDDERFAVLLAANERNSDGRDAQRRLDQALVHAALAGRAGATARLLEAGADATTRDPQWGTPLHAAARGGARGSPAVIDLLLAAGAELDSSRHAGAATPLMVAAAHAALHPLGALLARGATTSAGDEQGRGPLALAARGGHDGAVAALLRAGAEIDAPDRWQRTPLMHAAAHDVRCTALLLEAGADPDRADADGLTALAHAAFAGNAEAIDVLLSGGADPAAVGWIDVHAAAAAGDDARLRRAVRSSRESIDQPDRWGRTPLLWAAHRGDGAAMRLLLDAGAAIDARDEQGRTALLIAAERSPASLVDMLLAAGAAADVADEEGRTPLLAAATRRDGADLARTLLAAGADPARPDAADRTPLIEAAARCNVPLVALLLEAGAAPRAVDHLGRTAADFAAAAPPGERREETLRLLRQLP